VWGYGKEIIKEKPKPIVIPPMCSLEFQNERASMSSVWKDHRIKPYNPFKTTEFSPNWGTGAFTCIHTKNDKAGAWW